LDTDLTADPNGYTLSWAETGDPGLPLSLDFVFVAKAGDDFGAYLLEEIDFTASRLEGDGTFDITWLNNG